MPRKPKEYSFNDLDGCVSQTRSRITETMVGIYHGEQSGMQDEPEYPWITFCEEHGNLVGHQTLSLAKSWAPDPSGWCDDCRELLKRKYSL